MKKMVILLFLIIIILGYFFMFHKKETRLIYRITPGEVVYKIDKSIMPYEEIYPQIKRTFINNSNDSIILYNYYTYAYREHQKIIDSSIFNGVTWMLYDSLGNSPDKDIPPIDQVPANDPNYSDHLYTFKDDMKIYGYNPETYNSDELYRRITLNNKKIVPPHDTLIFRGPLDLSLFYKSLKPGKYKVASYYYIDENIEKEIGSDVYEKEKDKILMGLYKANEIELIVE